jgi:hypothetical protein
MVRLVWLLSSVVVSAQLVLAGPALADDPGTVTSYDSDYTVRTDGVLAVVETITVTFTRPRHGIFRTFDRSENGQAASTPDRASLSATVDGKKTRYAVLPTSTGINLRIGDPGVTITGTHVYRVLYTVTGAVVHGDDEGDKFDEVYWDTIGGEWALRILKSTGTFHLPGKAVDGSCGVGDGETDQCDGIGSDVVSFTTGALEPGTPVSMRVDYDVAPGMTYVLRDLVQGALLGG